MFDCLLHTSKKVVLYFPQEFPAFCSWSVTQWHGPLSFVHVCSDQWPSHCHEKATIVKVYSLIANILGARRKYQKPAMKLSTCLRINGESRCIIWENLFKACATESQWKEQTLYSLQKTFSKLLVWWRILTLTCRGRKVWFDPQNNYL